MLKARMQEMSSSTSSPIGFPSQDESTAWSCDIAQCFVIDTKEDVVAPYTGPWKESLALFIELKGSLPDISQSCKEVGTGHWKPRYHANKPLIFITSHPQYFGMWQFRSAKGNHFLCEIRYYAGKEFESNSYAVKYDPGSPNICVIPPPDEKEKASIDGSKAKAFLSPALKFHVRSTIFSLDDIQTANQTFRISVFIELRLRSICTSAHLVPDLMKDYGFNIHMFEVMNVVEHTSDIERWENGMRVDDTKFDYSFKYRYNSVLGEEYELDNFPFDLQDISLVGTLNIPTSRGELIGNEEFPSLFHNESFRLSSIYTVTYKEQVHTSIEVSKPSESSAGHTYPRVHFVMNLTRKQGYYGWNIALPMAVLTSLTALSIGVEESDGSRLSTGDRLQITLTLLLTSVAFKFVVAESLPRVSYQTTIDKYILMCNSFICLAAVENVLYPALAYDGNEDGEESFNEWYVMILFLLGFAVANAIFWIAVTKSFNERLQAHEANSKEEEMKRQHQAASFHQK